MLNVVTITTDISHCHELQVGSFAFWISTDYGPMKSSGMLKAPTNGSTCAEVACIARAVWYLAKSGIRTRRVVVNTDSLVGKKSIEKGVAKGHPTLVSAIRFIRETCASRGWELDVRHVRAHKKVTTKRQYVNDWCDKQAKEQLRTYRNGLRKRN